MRSFLSTSILNGILYRCAFSTSVLLLSLRIQQCPLGCLEWRTNPTVVRRSPRPKSASHRFDIPSIGESNGHSRADQSDSNSTVSCAECAMTGLVTDVIKPDTTNRSSQRTRARGGAADGLLRRLRMRPLSKNSRAKTPTPFGSEIAGRLASIPVRSSSTPRTSCMSKSFMEWTAAESNIFPNCSHGSRLNMTTSEESRFSPVSTPQRTESYPMVSVD
ncbi:hypothetical protein FBUS_01362 [Fasciolopsis buskii]|uniref:Secreted protein n=1 Tax=Fasciolopsis buskii TaxID=27845 RepID=A0A8E0RW85_9TREM|nr:hypothetical protein FBUS_01362 [Fasciolopsis buski]